MPGKRRRNQSVFAGRFFVLSIMAIFFNLISNQFGSKLIVVVFKVCSFFTINGRSALWLDLLSRSCQCKTRLHVFGLFHH